jgi:ABC-type glycerol-3-phosphate transport system substrate-binding protein
MKTKVLLIALAALIALGGGAWAQASKDVKGDIVVLTHRTDVIDTLFKGYVERFNKIYPNVKVSFEGITEYETTVRTRMNTKEYGDVLSMVTVPPLQADFGKFYEPLGSQKDLEKKYGFLTNFIYNGTVYGVAPNANASGFVYNKKVFEKAGIKTAPSTIDEFMADLRKIKAIGVAPLFLNYPSQWTLTQWEAYRVAPIGDPDYMNKIAHDPAPFAKGKPHYVVNKLLYDVVKEGLIESDPLTSDWENSKHLMAQGKIGVMALGAWAIGQMMDTAKADGLDPNDIGYMPFPYTVKGKMYSEVSADYALAINVNSKYKEAAKAWVFWMLDQSGYAADNRSIPSLVGGKYPEVLDAFSKLKVNYLSLTPAPAAEQGLTDKLDKESEIGFWQPNWRKRIVDAAMGTTKESFDDIMNDFNARWDKARKANGVK